MSLHTITRHLVRLGDGRKVTVESPKQLDVALGKFWSGCDRRGSKWTYTSDQIIEEQTVTVEVDRHGHRIDERIV